VAALGINAKNTFAVEPTGSPLSLGDRKWLTWDDTLFESTRGVTFEMQRPHRTGDRCLIADKPWESWQIGGMMSLLHDDGKFRLWYGVSHGIRHGEEYAVAYAESADGIHWTKPDLGLVEYAGSKQNNLVVGYSSVIGQVFIDPHAPAESRYRMLVAIYPTRDDDPPRYLALLESADGLRWSAPNRNVVPEGSIALDTQSQAFWDADRDAYVLFTRKGPWRQVARSESRDPYRFPAPEYVLQPEDPQVEDYYQSGATKYEGAAHAYFALAPVFFHPGDPQGQPLPGAAAVTANYAGHPITVAAPDTLDLHLFTSNDSIRWQRRGDHRPFIGLGLDGDFDSRSLYSGVGYATVGDEIWLYYSAYDCTHIGSLDGAAPFERYLGTITRATLRRDGFVAARAGHDGAELVTRPVTFTGRQLELNLDCSAGGSARVELLSPAGDVLPGFALDDCDPVFHNSVRSRVSWNGRSDLPALAGQSVRLRLILRDCDLYALQFATVAASH
jgi:hypothetical protein